MTTQRKDVAAPWAVCGGRHRVAVGGSAARDRRHRSGRGLAGTGKTETKLALFAVARPERLLVVVRSDAVRTQIAAKFETVGVVHELEAVNRASLRPCVGISDMASRGSPTRRVRIPVQRRRHNSQLPERLLV